LIDTNYIIVLLTTHWDILSQLKEEESRSYWWGKSKKKNGWVYGKIALSNKQVATPSNPSQKLQGVTGEHFYAVKSEAEVLLWVLVICITQYMWCPSVCVQTFVHAFVCTWYLCMCEYLYVCIWFCVYVFLCVPICIWLWAYT
jgi:hypothetical protein